MAEEGPAVLSTSAPRAHGAFGSGQVLTDGILQTQMDTIGAITVIADKLKEAVMRIISIVCEISKT